MHFVVSVRAKREIVLGFNASGTDGRCSPSLSPPYGTRFRSAISASTFPVRKQPWRRRGQQSPPRLVQSLVCFCDSLPSLRPKLCPKQNFHPAVRNGAQHITSLILGSQFGVMQRVGQP